MMSTSNSFLASGSSESNYHDLKVSFVSGHEGGALLEIIWILVSLPMSFSAARAQLSPNSSFLTQVHVAAIPILAWILLPMWGQFIIALLLLLLSWFSICGKEHTVLLQDKSLTYLEKSSDRPHHVFVSEFRSGLMLLTVICILAVDFPVFPRRFAKTEVQGLSLMDMGVGAFVFSMGLSSVFAQRNPVSHVVRFGQTLLAMLPLLILGLLRPLLLSLLNYPQHLSEYGVHWNFFLTLACLGILRSIFHPRLDHRLLAVCSLALLVIHQYILSAGAQSFVLAPGLRIGLFDENREGLVSLPAYLALLLVGEAVGSFIQTTLPATHALKLVGRLALLAFLLLTSAYGVMLLPWVGPVCRVVANAPYLLFTSGLSVLVLAFLLVSFLLVPATESRIISGINLNQLALFLIANILTGIVNLVIPTLLVGNILSTLILYLYVLSLCGIGYLLTLSGRRIRLRLPIAFGEKKKL